MNRIILIFMLMNPLSCAQITSDFYYVSLENYSDAQIGSRAKIQLKNLIKNSEIPKQYTLHREAYVLDLSIGDNSYRPHLKITVNGLRGQDLRLVPRRNINIVSSKGRICASYYLNAENPSVLDFSWSSNCLDSQIKKEISFNVIDQSDEIIGKEDIPFVLKKDGQYTLMDAL